MAGGRKDAFSLLTGGANFDKKRFARDVSKYEKTESAGQRGSAKRIPNLLGEEVCEADVADEEVTDDELRSRFRMVLRGSDPPALLRDFRAASLSAKPFGLPESVATAVADLGIVTPSPVQMQAVSALSRGRSCMACAPTGSGKTLAFLLPLISVLKNPKRGTAVRALLVAPTKDIARQIKRQLLKLVAGWTVDGEPTKWKVAISSKFLPKGIPFDQRKTLESAAKEGDKSAKKEIKRLQDPTFNHDVVITTPQGIANAVEGGVVHLSNVRMAIFDEADHLFEEGFLPAIDTLLTACTSKKLTQAFFSATFAPKTEELISSVTHDALTIHVDMRHAAARSVEQSLKYCGEETGKLLLVRDLALTGEVQPPALIFLQSRDRAQQLYHELRKTTKLKVGLLHKALPQHQRDSIVDKFRTGEIWVMVCTDILARGMDFPQVNMVINYDLPTSTADYVHRVGRAGRAGRPGKAITLFTDEDSLYIRPVANIIRESGSSVPDFVFKMKKVQADEQARLKTKPVYRGRSDSMPLYQQWEVNKRSQMAAASQKRTYAANEHARREKAKETS